PTTIRRRAADSVRREYFVLIKADLKVRPKMGGVTMVTQAFRVSVASTIATALWWLLVSAPVAGQEGGGGGGAGFRAAPIAGCPQISRLFWPCAKPKAAAFNPPRNP